MHGLDSIRVPTPVLDEPRVRQNISAMADRARRQGIVFRPHFKTHQCAEIGEWFREEGVKAITVSSLRMADYFAAAGWSDLCVAFPFNPREAKRASALAERIDLSLLVQSVEGAHSIDKGVQSEVEVRIKIDAGYGRAGIDWRQADAVHQVAAALCNGAHTHFGGLLVHSGHSYHHRGFKARAALHQECLERLLPLQADLRATFGSCRLSVGDTPCCTLLDDLGPVDEMRPGNFVFFDLQQWASEVCQGEQLAMAVACPVVAVDHTRDRLVLYGGAVHLSHDRVTLANGASVIGLLSAHGPWRSGLQNLGCPDPEAAVVSVSQEHGVVQLAGGAARGWQEGDLALVFPAHSCLACEPHPHYQLLNGAVLPRFRLA